MLLTVDIYWREVIKANIDAWRLRSLNLEFTINYMKTKLPSLIFFAWFLKTCVLSLCPLIDAHQIGLMLEVSEESQA